MPQTTAAHRDKHMRLRCVSCCAYSSHSGFLQQWTRCGGWIGETLQFEAHVDLSRFQQPCTVYTLPPSFLLGSARPYYRYQRTFFSSYFQLLF
jgi:hypothetical protein